ncbi:MAG: hypothetical protein GEV09_09710 [Pseudonocardiaceae bacterium]|nr:hypothetical protein [Pseudonocardiaceae bacterium]
MTPLNDAASALAIVALIVTMGYLLACAAWPFAPCRRCHGTGCLRAPLGRAFRLCPRCRATGRRLRAGRRAYTHLTRHYRHGHPRRDTRPPGTRRR